MGKLLELSLGRVRLAAGTLYAALDRLTTEGLIRVVDEQVVNGRARRYYKLTRDGRAALQAEAARLAQAARVVIQPVYAVAAACLLWTVVDLRAPIAGGALLLGPVLSLLGFYLPGWANGRSENLVRLLSYAVAAVVLVAVGALTARRQIRL